MKIISKPTILRLTLFSCIAITSNSFAIEKPTLKINYKFHHGACPPNITSLIEKPEGLTLQFKKTNKVISLIKTKTPGTEISHPIKLSNTGLEGMISFMSTTPTDLIVKKQEYLLTQLWIEKKPTYPAISGFYLGEEKQCSITNYPVPEIKSNNDASFNEAFFQP